MGGFAWGSSNEPIDPKLALAQIATDAGEAEPEDQSFVDEAESVQEGERDDTDVEASAWEEMQDPPLPPALETFRRRAHINTYTDLPRQT